MPRDTVAGLGQSVRALEMRHDITAAKVEIHDRLLVRGNGQPSLCEAQRATADKVTRLEDTVRRYIDGVAEERQYWSRKVLNVVIGQLVAGLVFAAILLIRLAPLVEKLERLQ